MSLTILAIRHPFIWTLVVAHRRSSFVNAISRVSLITVKENADSLFRGVTITGDRREIDDTGVHLSLTCYTLIHKKENIT